MTLRTGLGKPNLDVSRNPKFASGYLVPRGGGGGRGLGFVNLSLLGRR